MMEKDKAQAEFRMKANSDKSELAGLLYQIKAKMMEKGLVSAEELDEYKAKNLALQAELDKTRRELAKKAQDDTPKANAKAQQKNPSSVAGQRKDQGIQCVAERHITSADKPTRDSKAGKGPRGLMAVFEDFTSGYTESLVFLIRWWL